jgi:hypothetical protein
MTTIQVFSNGVAIQNDDPEEALQEGLRNGDLSFEDGPIGPPKQEEVEDTEELIARYGEIEDHGETVSGEPTMLETFGSDYELVQRIAKQWPQRVWTIVDGDDGLPRVTAGLHFVNRIGYITTPKPWQREDEEYLWS